MLRHSLRYHEIETGIRREGEPKPKQGSGLTPKASLGLLLDLRRESSHHHTGKLESALRWQTLE